MHITFQHRSTMARRACGAMVKSTTVVLLSAVLLASCSGMRLVDSDVSAFSSSAIPAATTPASYRFERLPSQQARAERSSTFEALAETALARVGLRRDDAAPQYTVQLDLRTFRDPQAPWDDGRYLAGYAAPFPVVTRYGTVMHYPSLSVFVPEFPYYRRELGLVLRRTSDHQVVFETRAKHDGRWPDDDAVLSAMLQAALRDFPNPPPGLRHIVIEIPR